MQKWRPKYNAMHGSSLPSKGWSWDFSAGILNLRPVQPSWTQFLFISKYISSHFFFHFYFVRTFKIQSLSNYQVYNYSWIIYPLYIYNGFPGGSGVKNTPANTGDSGDASLIPGLGRSPGGGRDNSLQYSCQRNPMERGAWQATVHGVTKSWTQLSE